MSRVTLKYFPHLFICRKLWCGVSEGRMSVFSFRGDGLVIGQESVSHPGTQQPHPRTTSYDDLQPATALDDDIRPPPPWQEGEAAIRVEEEGNVLLAYAPDKPHTVSSKLRRSLWTYVYPGQERWLLLISLDLIRQEKPCADKLF